VGIDWNDHPKLPLRRHRLRKALAYALHNANVYVTATSDGVHAAHSYHYLKRAFDLGSNDSRNRPEAHAQEMLYRKFGAGYFRELFGPLDWYVKDGHFYHGRAPDVPNHLHVAV
jgi:hypothetical protein